MNDILKELNAIVDPDMKGANGLPNRKVIVFLLKETQLVLFPEYFEFSELTQEEAYIELEACMEKMIRRTARALHVDLDAKEATQSFLHQLPEVKRLLLTDIQAIYDGDPAAKSKAEIVLCYPGFYATTIYRIAHVLYALHVPYMPRVMSEYAHEKTGIDINPGAVILDHFCIDHGTGIVVGETATIGHHVKIYQGVTIGAKSFELDENGNPLKGGKRHPDIGNHVVIYANATILGGDTVVGDDCVIGGNVWLLHSVPKGSKLTYSNCKDDKREL